MQEHEKEKRYLIQHVDKDFKVITMAVKIHQQREI